MKHYIFIGLLTLLYSCLIIFAGHFIFNLETMNEHLTLLMILIIVAFLLTLIALLFFINKAISSLEKKHGDFLNDIHKKDT